MSINYKRHILPIIGVFLLIIFSIATIYLVGKRVVEDSAPPVADPEVEHQKYLEDTSITNTYFGDLPCEDCEGVRLTLSLTRESEDSVDGVFTMSRVYLDSDRDVETITGTWSLDENENFVLEPDIGEELLVERIDENTFELEGEELILLD